MAAMCLANSIQVISFPPGQVLRVVSAPISVSIEVKVDHTPSVSVGVGFARVQSSGREDGHRRLAGAHSHGGVTTMTGDRRLLKLAVGNLILGVVAALLAPIRVSTFGLDHILLVPLFASILCQAVLLSLWGATSRVPPWGRMAGLVAGSVYLEALWFSGDLRRGSFGVSTITIAITTAICLVGRARACGSPSRTTTTGPHEPRPRG